jgi:hypothetical protein
MLSRGAPVSKWTKAPDMLGELFPYQRRYKKYWLLPIVLMMALFGGLFVLTRGSAVAPFIYTVF